MELVCYSNNKRYAYRHAGSSYTGNVMCNYVLREIRTRGFSIGRAPEAMLV